MTKSWDKVFIDFSCEKLQQLTDRICDCLDRLDNQQIWSRGSQNENAIGNLVLHLCGNVRQWIGYGVGGRPDIRERDLEFAGRGGIDAAELKERLRTTISEGILILRKLTPERLEQITTIQGFEITILEAVYHVVEHFSGHAGQIFYCTKQFTGKDLGFYAHLKQSGSHQDKTP